MTKTLTDVGKHSAVFVDWSWKCWVRASWVVQKGAVTKAKPEGGLWLIISRVLFSLLSSSLPLFFLSLPSCPLLKGNPFHSKRGTSWIEEQIRFSFQLWGNTTFATSLPNNHHWQRWIILFLPVITEYSVGKKIEQDWGRGIYFETWLVMSITYY